MTYTSTFGPLITRGQVEQAVVSTLQNPPANTKHPLIVYYLADLERQLGLAPRTIPVPPSADSYRGGIDFNNWVASWLPQVTVGCEPVGDAERYDAGRYTQVFEIQIAAIVQAQDEDAARQLADWYGIAIAGALGQQGGLGTRTDFDTGQTMLFAEKTVLVATPRTEFLPNPPDKRQLCRSVTVFHTFVQDVVREQGPIVFGPDPYVSPSPWPTVTETAIQLSAETPAGTFSPATGITETTPVGLGDVVVTE